MILSSIITTNLVPYLTEFFKIFVRKVLCRKLLDHKRSNDFYVYELKNAQLLAVIFLSFTFGYQMPIIFVF